MGYMERDRSRQSGQPEGNLRWREIRKAGRILACRGSEMLQLRGANGRPVTGRVTYSQTIRRARGSEEGIIEQGKGQKKADPLVSWKPHNCPAKIGRNVHPGLFRTIVGLPGWVKRLPRLSFFRGGEGDRRQGCTGPLGGTLRKDHAWSVSGAVEATNPEDAVVAIDFPLGGLLSSSHSSLKQHSEPGMITAC